mmetsp:Transcript_12138/g.15034  ORF Transcript_12138/g.15034 Transcript_12138/m.15034 type:complete len:377 (-) Transcript_12138:1113-2243(-)
MSYNSGSPLSASSSSQEEKPILFQLIKNQQWRKLRRFLSSRRGFELCQERDSSNLSCLSMALGYGAPISVIEDMIRTDTSLAKVKDNFGATAFHVACLNGAPIQLINALIYHYENDGMLKELDMDGRCPLHHAVENACRMANETDDSYMEVLQRLCEVAPEVVHLEDKTNLTPIDLVQVAKLELAEASKKYKRLDDIYVMLRDTGIRFYTTQKRRWEIEGFIVPPVVSLSSQLPSSSQSRADSRPSLASASTTSHSVSTGMTPQSNISRFGNSFHSQGKIDENLGANIPTYRSHIFDIHAPIHGRPPQQLPSHPSTPPKNGQIIMNETCMHDEDTDKDKKMEGNQDRSLSILLEESTLSSVKNKRRSGLKRLRRSE